MEKGKLMQIQFTIKTGEIAQWLRKLAAFADNQNLIHNPHVVRYNFL